LKRTTRDDTPQGENQYRARFYLNPNGVAIPTGAAITLFSGYSGVSAPAPVFNVQMQKYSGTYQVRICALIGEGEFGTWISSDWYDLSAGWNALETEFISSYNTGKMSLWVGGSKPVLVRGNAIARPRQVC